MEQVECKAQVDNIIYALAEQGNLTPNQVIAQWKGTGADIIVKGRVNKSRSMYPQFFPQHVRWESPGMQAFFRKGLSVVQAGTADCLPFTK